jgi:hypothetical protein
MWVVHVIYAYVKLNNVSYLSLETRYLTDKLNHTFQISVHS